MAIRQLDLVVLDRAFVRFDGALVLHHHVLLVFILLPGDGIPIDGRFVAIQIHDRFGEQAFIVLERSFRLGKGGFIRARVDVDERITLLDDLAFLIVHRHHLPGNLAVKGDGVEGRYGAESIHIDVDVAGFRLPNGDCSALLCLLASLGPGRVLFGNRTKMEHDENAQNQQRR